MTTPKKTRFIVDKREARADNSSHVLNIDGSAAGRIYAFIDEDLFREMTAQFARRTDTRDVIPLHREGHAVEYVTYTSSLREILTNEDAHHFDCDDEIDRWVEELQSLAQYLKEFKERCRREAQNIHCSDCPHTLFDHERPDGSDSSCHYQGCECRGFFPIDPGLVN